MTADFNEYKYKYKTIKIMFDYCSSGIWGSKKRSPYGGMLDAESIRLNKRTAIRLEKWLKEYDELMSYFYFRYTSKYTTNGKSVIKSSKFKQLEKEQLIIAKQFKRQYKGKNIIIFNERKVTMNNKNYMEKI